MCPVRERVHILEGTEEGRSGDDERRERVVRERLDARHASFAHSHVHKFDALAANNVPHGRSIGGMHRRRYRDPTRSYLPVGADRHQHGLCQGRRAVVHRCVGHFHFRQCRQHGLELVDELQSALTRLRLVRRVRGQEFTAGRQVPDGSRHVMLIRAGANETEGRAVARGTLRNLAQQRSFANSRPDRGEITAAQSFRNLIKQLIDRGDAKRPQHHAFVTIRMWNERHSAFPNGPQSGVPGKAVGKGPPARSHTQRSTTCNRSSADGLCSRPLTFGSPRVDPGRVLIGMRGVAGARAQCPCETAGDPGRERRAQEASCSHTA